MSDNALNIKRLELKIEKEKTKQELLKIQQLDHINKLLKICELQYKTAK
jgi:hypothetical protein